MVQDRSEIDLEELTGRMPALLTCGAIVDTCKVHLPGSQAPWQPTGVRLVAGQQYSLFARGTITWSPRYPGLHAGPRFHLWARVRSGGRAVNVTANSDTFTADCDGELELGIYMGLWADEFGTLATSTELYRDLGGALDVVALVYAGTAESALVELCRRPDAPRALLIERERLSQAVALPDGWHYLHETGYGSIYHAGESDTGPVINATADDDQGILRRPVAFPLTSETLLKWRWRVDEHPSAAREDRAITHDYISVAAEFDNGRDLTWIWSSCLPLGAHFACPVRAWSARETHWVVRSGDDRLGRWYAETRRVFDDVSAAMGPPPGHITAIWLIALSTFQHRTACASFAEITLEDGPDTLTVL